MHELHSSTLWPVCKCCDARLPLHLSVSVCLSVRAKLILLYSTVCTGVYFFLCFFFIHFHHHQYYKSISLLMLFISRQNRSDIFCRFHSHASLRFSHCHSPSLTLVLSLSFFKSSWMKMICSNTIFILLFHLQSYTHTKHTHIYHFSLFMSMLLLQLRIQFRWIKKEPHIKVYWHSFNVVYIQQST